MHGAACRCHPSRISDRPRALRVSLECAVAALGRASNWLVDTPREQWSECFDEGAAALGGLVGDLYGHGRDHGALEQAALLELAQPQGEQAVGDADGEAANS